MHDQRIVYAVTMAAETLGAVSAGMGLAGVAWTSAKGFAEALEKIKGHDDNIEEIRDETDDLIRSLQRLQETANTRPELSERLEIPLRRCQQICEKLRDIANEYSKHSEGKGRPSTRDAIRYLWKEKGVTELRERLTTYKLSILVALGTTDLDVRMSEASQTRESLPAGTIRNFGELISECSSKVTQFLEAADVQLRAIPVGTLDARKKRLEMEENRVETLRCLTFVTEGLSSVEGISQKLIRHKTQGGNESSPPTNIKVPTRFAVAEFQKSTDHLREMKSWLESYGKSLDQQISTSETEVAIEDPIDDLLREEACSREILPIISKALEVQERALHVFEDIEAHPDSDQTIAVMDSSHRLEARRITARERSTQRLGLLPEAFLTPPAQIPIRSSVVQTARRRPNRGGWARYRVHEH